MVGRSVALTERQLSILSLTRYGRGRMDYLIDALSVDIRALLQDLTVLVGQGYLRRKGSAGGDMFAFELTSSGNKVLPALSVEDERLRQQGLSPDDLRMLRHLQGRDPMLIEQIAEPLSIPESQLLSAINFHVAESGFLVESGLLRRRISLSSAGEAIVLKHSAVQLV